MGDVSNLITVPVLLTLWVTAVWFAVAKMERIHDDPHHDMLGLFLFVFLFINALVTVPVMVVRVALEENRSTHG